MPLGLARIARYTFDTRKLRNAMSIEKAANQHVIIAVEGSRSLVRIVSRIIGIAHGPFVSNFNIDNNLQDNFRRNDRSQRGPLAGNRIPKSSATEMPLWA